MSSFKKAVSIAVFRRVTLRTGKKLLKTEAAGLQTAKEKRYVLLLMLWKIFFFFGSVADKAI